MHHPFNLSIDELVAINIDGVAQLTDDESATIQGGNPYVSQTLTAVGPNESGEAGGSPTTLAVGEEGGDMPGDGMLPFPLIPIPSVGYSTSGPLALEAG